MAQQARAAEAVARNGTGTRIEVVALVASAGGLEAITRVLSDLPAEFEAAVVVAQHLSGQGSTLVEILARRVSLPVGWARDGAKLEPGQVLVCPPRSVLEVLPDRTCSIRRAERGGLDRPLDGLLTSIGDSFGSAALALVLTGMGDDGAAGAAALREAGGLVIAQSEDTAEQPSMPRAAVAAGAVDLVLPLHDIGAVVADVVFGRPLPRPDHEEEAIRFAFGERGVVAELARAIDWGATPLGAVSAWPEAQRVVMRLAAQSAHGVTLFLGEGHHVFPNEVSIPLVGGRHEFVFARPYAEAFPEAVDSMVPALERARMGEQVRQEAMHVSFVRHGRLEDRWYDMSLTPICVSDGRVLGVQQTFLDRTEEVLSRRRLEALNRLTSAATARNWAEAVTAAVRTLTDAADVPFAAAYQFDAARAEASLVAVCGVEPASGMAPHRLRLAPGAVWPLRRVAEEAAEVVLDDMADRFRGQRVGDEGISVDQAVLYPLRGDGKDDGIGGVVGIVVLGVHPRVPLDARYRKFITLVGEAIGARANEAHARQRERRRLERLAELDRAKTDFFSNVSHEFRTPLTLMLGPLNDLLQDDEELRPERKAELELVRRNARRLLRLVGTMLDFSQIEAGHLRARFAPVDLTARTREIVAQFESALDRAGLDLRLDLEQLPQPVWIDADMWEKIVSNLLSNALKFTFAGAIEVTLRTLPKHAELVVRDSGVGIAQDELPHIFKRFHRVPGTPARTYEGAGIGLALVHELVRRHHGRIRATSTVGEGTAFTVWIPLGPRHTEEAAHDEPSRPPEVAAAMAEEAMGWGTAPEPQLLDDGALRQPLRNYAPGARILVADDNRDMREYLRRLLNPHWRVEAASDGAEALELARANPPELVLADVMMPGIDGFALLRELRSDDTLRSTPVILVTARAGEESAIEGLLAGADDYIVKPFSARELVARVGGQLELARARRHAAELNAFRIGLSDALRALSDPIHIQQTACRMLVGQLGADRARFVEVDEAAGEFITMGGYAIEGMPGGFGRYPLDEYAPLAHGIFAGRAMAIEDTQSDPGVAEIRDALAKLEIRAQLVLPLVRNGAAQVALAVHQRTTRRWTAEDLALAEEAAGRAWAEVERARAETALRASQERQAFLLRLSDALRTLSDGAEIKAAAATILGKHLGVNRAFYSEMVSDEWIIDGVFEQDVAPLPAGRYPAGSYGRWTMDTLSDGRVVAIADTAHDGRLRPPERQALHLIDVAAVVAVPLVRNDTVVAVLSLQSRRPHRWTDEELELVQETADRTWPAVERARAEAAVQASEERQAFLLRLSDALRPLADPGEIQHTAARVLGEHLTAARVMYAEVEGDAGSEVGTLRAWYLPGEPPSSGPGFPERYSYSDFDKQVMASRRRGETMVVTDVMTDPRFGTAERTGWAAGGVLAAITVALVKEQRWVAEFGVHSATPREWTAEEVRLVEETAERTWATVERARAEATVRDQEALLADHNRLRTMVNTPGIGILTWDTAHGTLLDANDAFLEMSGYTREQIHTGDITWRRLTAEEDVAESERQLLELAHTGRIAPYEKDLIRADGSRSLMLYAGAAISDRTCVEYCIDLQERVSRT